MLSEYQEALKIEEWRLNNLKQYPILEYSVCHLTGSKMSIGVIAKTKKIGALKKGIPDYFFPIPTKDSHGLWLELKKEKGGKVSLEQKKWIIAMNNLGYSAHVVEGAKEAIHFIEHQLKNWIMASKRVTSPV